MTSLPCWQQMSKKGGNQMHILSRKLSENGGYSVIQTWPGDVPPEGYVIVPDTLDTSVFYEFLGFVDLTIEGDTVTAMTGNQTALDAYKASLPEPVDPPPTTEERVATLESENAMLKAKVSAQSDQMDFYEDCIAEMAAVVYA